MASNKVIIENAKLIFRNFSGRKDKYNRDGNRTVGLVFKDEVLARQMSDDGWNIKVLPPREDYPDEGPAFHLPVKVSYSKKPPVIYMLNPDRTRIPVTEEQVCMLDSIDIDYVDACVSAYHYATDEGETRVSAYLDTLIVSPRVDELARKYADYTIKS